MNWIKGSSYALSTWKLQQNEWLILWFVYTAFHWVGTLINFHNKITLWKHDIFYSSTFVDSTNFPWRKIVWIILIPDNDCFQFVIASIILSMAEENSQKLRKQLIRKSFQGQIQSNESIFSYPFTPSRLCTNNYEEIVFLYHSYITFDWKLLPT